MGGKNSGGSNSGTFVERGTPLSAEMLANRNHIKAESAKQAAEVKQQQQNATMGGGNTGDKSHEGGVVDANTAAAIGAAALAGVTTGVLAGPVTGAYSAYKTYGYVKDDPEAHTTTTKEDRGFIGTLAGLFGSLLGDDEDGTDGSSGSNGSGGGFGGGGGPAGLGGADNQGQGGSGGVMA
jgi:hypothetical protein